MTTFNQEWPIPLSELVEQAKEQGRREAIAYAANWLRIYAEDQATHDRMCLFRYAAEAIERGDPPPRMPQEPFSAPDATRA